MSSSSAFSEYLLATRPWSFTAAAIPILVTAAVTNTPFLSERFFRAVVMGITVQAGANLTNTYYDFVNGVDSKDCGERTLVERKVSSTGVVVLSAVCYLLGLVAILPQLTVTTDLQLGGIFALGISLAFFYTANPIGLKYHGLGDITIFVCFGPLLMQGTSMLFTGHTTDLLYIYSVPVGLLTEAILHVNNARDIKADSKAGATTLATVLGPKGSYLAYLALLVASYLSVAVIAFLYHWGCLATLLTVPLAVGLINNYKSGKMLELPEQTAQLHLPFGLLMLFGILLTEKGILSLL